MWIVVIGYVWKRMEAVVDYVHMIADKITIQTQKQTNKTKDQIQIITGL